MEDGGKRIKPFSCLHSFASIPPRDSANWVTVGITPFPASSLRFCHLSRYRNLYSEPVGQLNNKALGKPSGKRVILIWELRS